MPAVFVSDVHLLETANPKDSEFLRWLESLSDVTLYILGDLFDLWWSFEEYVPIGYRAVCQCLRDKVQQGMSIYFLGGNRDFSSRYLLSLGIQPLSCGIYSIEGRSIYLAHGDEADRSTGYRLVKTVLRSRAFAQAMSWLGPEKGYRLLRYLKSGSAEVRLGGTKLLNYQKDWVRQKGYSFAIMGHSHYLGAFSLGRGELVLLGDWPNQQSYFVLDEAGGSLYSFHKPVEVGLFRKQPVCTHDGNLLGRVD